MQTYSEILSMITKACDIYFNTGSKNLHAEIVESATKIYTKQMELNFEREKAEMKNK